MWRALVFVGLLCVAAVAAVWLADRPGSVSVTFGGYQIQTTVAVAAVALVGVAFALAVLWSAVNALLHLPSRMNFATRARRRARGYKAISRGMVAVGAGDAIAARRNANEAERLLGNEPLTLLLKAQAAQVSGNRAAAEAAFSRMMDDEDTRVLGLRGLFVEARRRGDLAAATQYAVEAVRLAPAASWASDAVLEAHCAAHDWRGAVAAIDRRASIGLADKATTKRHRAVLLAADALDQVERDPDGALSIAQEAVKLAPDLVPAAALASRLLAQRGDLRRAARIIETAWKSQPHPDLAEVYLNLRNGDSALDRLKRAETLLRISKHDAEGRLTLARAAMDAREFARARMALEPLLADRPPMRICLLMSDLEQAEHGTTGHGREWLARAARAPRDPAWIADGIVSDRWQPISPVTGRLDAFRWEAPPDVLVAPELHRHDDVTADLDDETRVIAAAPAPEEPARAPEPEPEPASTPQLEAAAAEPAAEPSSPESGESPKSAPAEVSPPTHERDVAKPTLTLVEHVAEPAAKPDGGAAKNYEPAPVIFPVEHAPDDPGAEDDKPARRGLFR
jgi:HemY protein